MSNFLYVETSCLSSRPCYEAPCPLCSLSLYVVDVTEVLLVLSPPDCPSSVTLVFNSDRCSAGFIVKRSCKTYSFTNMLTCKHCVSCPSSLLSSKKKERERQSSSEVAAHYTISYTVHKCVLITSHHIMEHPCHVGLMSPCWRNSVGMYGWRGMYWRLPLGFSALVTIELFKGGFSV